MRLSRALLIAAGLLFGAALAGHAASTVTSFPSTASALVGIYNLLAGTLTVSGSLTTSTPAVSMTQTPALTLSAGVDATLVADSATTPRKAICIQNIGTGTVNLAFGSAATAGQGMALDGATAAGGQGGAYCPDSAVPTNAIHGISAAGSKVAVTVGN